MPVDPVSAAILAGVFGNLAYQYRIDIRARQNRTVLKRIAEKNGIATDTLPWK